MEVVLASLSSYHATTFVPHLLGYIDPSLGSLVFQVAAASLISASLFFRGLRERIIWLAMSLFRSRKSDGAVAERKSSSDAAAG